MHQGSWFSISLAAMSNTFVDELASGGVCAYEVAVTGIGSALPVNDAWLNAQLAELVDALVSGTSAARRGGSSPLLGTIQVCLFFCK
jgi:hypothetical protein